MFGMDTSAIVESGNGGKKTLLKPTLARGSGRGNGKSMAIGASFAVVEMSRRYLSYSHLLLVKHIPWSSGDESSGTVPASSQTIQLAEFDRMIRD
jgi:hypothetical protein